MKSKHYRGYDLAVRPGNMGGDAVRVSRKSTPMIEYQCSTLEESEAAARKWIDEQAEHEIAPGDFVQSALGGYWCGIVIERADLMDGECKGYNVRKGNGEIDWIGAEYTILIAPAYVVAEVRDESE